MASRWSSWGAVGMVVAVAGCFGPDLPSNISCAQDLRCPQGLICDPVDRICRSSPDTPTADAAPAGDSGPDSDGPPASSFCSHAGVVLCLEFEQSITDGSARGNTVTEIAGEAQYAAGKTGDALSLDGSVVLSIPSYRPGAAAETIEMWMRPTAGGLQGVLGSETEVEIRTATSMVGAASGGSSIMSGILNPTQLLHLAVRISDDQFELLVNGVSLGSEPFTDGSPMPSMVVGVDLEGASPYVGTIDQLRVWTRALSDDEINDIVKDGDI